MNSSNADVGLAIKAFIHKYQLPFKINKHNKATQFPYVGPGVTNAVGESSSLLEELNTIM